MADHEGVAGYIVDLIDDGPDESVKIILDDEGNFTPDLNAANLYGFRILDAELGEVAILVGQPEELLTGFVKKETPRG